ncbi:hypothetical protein D3C71_1093970 [compost metagenome]
MEKAEQRHARLAGPRAGCGNLRFRWPRVLSFFRRDCGALLQSNLQLDLYRAVIKLLHHTTAVGTQTRHAGVDTVINAVFAMLGSCFRKAGEMEPVRIGAAVYRKALLPGA